MSYSSTYQCFQATITDLHMCVSSWLLWNILYHIILKYQEKEVSELHWTKQQLSDTHLTWSCKGMLFILVIACYAQQSKYQSVLNSCDYGEFSSWSQWWCVRGGVHHFYSTLHGCNTDIIHSEPEGCAIFVPAATRHGTASAVIQWESQTSSLSIPRTPATDTVIVVSNRVCWRGQHWLWLTSCQCCGTS